MSDVAYKPAVPYSKKYNTPILQQKEYVQTWAEFSAKNRQQIIKSVKDFVGSGDVAVVVVPKGFTLYITTAFMSVAWSSTSINEESVYLYSTETNTELLTSQYSPDNYNSHDPDPYKTDNLCLTFPMPIKISAGKEIHLYVHANATASCGITGWLETNTTS